MADESTNINQGSEAGVAPGIIDNLPVTGGDEGNTPDPPFSDLMQEAMVESGIMAKEELKLDSPGKQAEGEGGDELKPVDPIPEDAPKPTELRTLGDPNENKTETLGLPEGDKKEDEGGKEKDELLNELPGLTEEGQKRFTKLQDGYKAAKKDLEDVSGQFNSLRTMITDVATPEEFGQALEYIRLIKSGDPKQIKAALATIDQQRSFLAKAIGENVEGVDLLDDFPDLRQRVDDVALTEEDAGQIAHSRRMQKQQDDYRQQSAVNQKQGAQWESRVNDAAKTVAAYETELKAKDPDFIKLREMITPQLNQIAKSVAPEDWGPSYLKAYGAVKAAFATKTVGDTQKPQPLAVTGAASGKTAPKTVQDAVLQYFGM